MKNLFVTFLFSILICLSGQSAFKYRIWLSDKGDTPYSLEYPEAYLSEKAIARREKQNNFRWTVPTFPSLLFI